MDKTIKFFWVVVIVCTLWMTVLGHNYPKIFGWSHQHDYLKVMLEGSLVGIILMTITKAVVEAVCRSNTSGDSDET